MRRMPLSPSVPVPALRRLVAFVALAAACGPGSRPTTADSARAPAVAPPSPAALSPDVPPRLDPDAEHPLVPVPVRVALAEEDSFVIDSTSAIVFDAAADPATERVAGHLATLLRPTVAAPVRRLEEGEMPPPRSIELSLDGRDTLGAEGYELVVGRDRVVIRAAAPTGLFYGVQTLRQLLPPAVEQGAAIDRRLALPVGRVSDAPRFAWRGLMLDVARHFLPAADVKRFIDAMALYKLNRLHLHLADDQGWRIEIRSWPRLAEVGGRTEVGGGTGGYYTQAEYRDLVAYAAERHVTIVPEIDMPGHTNAALVSYPELNCDGRTLAPYTGTRVGFSTLCVERDTVYRFVDDVVRELAALTPGPWIHLGGDEVEKLTPAQYARFVERVEGIVRAHGKRMVGWHDVAAASLDTSTVLQHWRRNAALEQASQAHAARGGTVILSPSSKIYLDMKYDARTSLGLRWAGTTDVRESYDWDPRTYLPSLPEHAILGVEGPLWSETVEEREEFEYLAFPRLLAVAEIGWSPQEARRWSGFRRRLGLQGARLAALGINFYRSPQVDWAR